MFNANIIDNLNNGGVGLLPSDTIYGLSALALDEKAIDRIYKLKGRKYDKPLIILLADVEQSVLLGLDSKDLKPMNRIWPAPLTLVVPSGRQTPESLHRGSRTLAIRVPDNASLLKLMKQTGPLVSSSANPVGKKPARSVKQARDYFGDKLDFYIDVGELKNKPSTIVRFRNGQVEVIRQGAFRV